MGPATTGAVLSLTSHAIRAETTKPACGSGSTSHAYNTPLHVFALFLILVLSILACSFPIAAKKFPWLPVPHRALFFSRHFGTGVLLATAFVHLLPTAYTSLTDPCLPSFWNERYPAMAGLIAMTSMFVVVGIEMFFATKGAGHSHSAFEDTRHVPLEDGPTPIESHRARTGRETRKTTRRRFEAGDLAQGRESTESLVRSSEHERQSADVFRHTPSDGQFTPHDKREDDSDLDVDLNELDPRTTRHTHDHELSTGQSTPVGGSFLSEEQQQQKALLQCLLLEAGILFHSVFIGMAVSVATGTPFIVLLIAISFHQTFEGLALGSRIAGITAFSPRSPKPWLMALAYGTTTPLGQAIGLFVHNLYDPYSQTGLLMVGIMNAISSGLLLFAGLVELLAEDFLSDKSYETLQGARRLEACGAVFAGSMLMALVGAWA